MSLTIQPMQWGSLPLLHDAPALDESDAACLDDLRRVLARHGKLGRFAVHLAHKHMDLAPGEVWIERPDPDGRTQHVMVGRLSDEPDARPTTWLFPSYEESGGLSAAAGAVYCVCVPVNPALFSGCAAHGKSNSPGEGRLKEEVVTEKRTSEDRARYEQGFPAGGHDRGRER